MTNPDHERALDLIMRQGAEDIAARDAAWLQSHLEACSECARYADDFHNTGRLLRAVAVTAGSSLVATTQQRLRVRALEMREQQTRMVLIAISFCIGALSSALSAYLWWRFGGWAVERFSLPVSIVAPGIFLFLLLPAVVIAALMLTFPHSIAESRLMQGLAREREGES